MGPKSFCNLRIGARTYLYFFMYKGLMHGCLIVFISRVIKWNCFSKMWRISLPRILQNNDLPYKLKTAGVITNDGFLECIILYNALCTMHAGETMRCKPCYNEVSPIIQVHSKKKNMQRLATKHLSTFGSPVPSKTYLTFSLLNCFEKYKCICIFISHFCIVRWQNCWWNTTILPSHIFKLTVKSLI